MKISSAIVTVLRAPLRKVAPHGVREAVLLAAGRVLGLGHGTNASGNNRSQR